MCLVNLPVLLFDTLLCVCVCVCVCRCVTRIPYACVIFCGRIPMISVDGAFHHAAHGIYILSMFSILSCMSHTSSLCVTSYTFGQFSHANGLSLVSRARQFVMEVCLVSSLVSLLSFFSRLFSARISFFIEILQSSLKRVTNERQHTHRERQRERERERECV